MAKTDSKSTYFGQGNRGMATILQRAEQGSFFDSALRVAGRKQAAKQKEQDAILENLTPDDVWAPYSAAANNLLEQGLEEYAKGNLDRAGAMKLAVQYKNAQSQAKGMQEAHKEALSVYQKDNEINEGFATDWRFKSIVGDGSLNKLGEIVNKGVNDFGFVNEWGGSEGLNESNVVSNLVGDLRTTLEEFSQGEQKEYVGPGSMRVTQEKVKQLVNQAFTTTRDEQGNLKVSLKDAETLKQEGLLDSFMENERFNRIVMDALWKESGQQRTSFRPDEIEAKAMELINLYGADQQEVTTDQDSQGFRYSVPSQRGGRGKDDVDAQERMTEWYRHLQSGNQELVENAASYLAGTVDMPGADLIEILPQNIRDEWTSTNSRKKDLNNTDFTITNADVNGGIVTLTVIPDKTLGGFWTGKPFRKGQSTEVQVDLSANTSPEFWNKYYNLAKQRSNVGDDKPHYNENKGGDIGGAVTPSSTQSTNQTTYDPNDPL